VSQTSFPAHTMEFPKQRTSVEVDEADARHTSRNGATIARSARHFDLLTRDLVEMAEGTDEPDSVDLGQIGVDEEDGSGIHDLEMEGTPEAMLQS